jgi:hypothetical protein
MTAGAVLFPDAEPRAEFDETGRYRYVLRRRWGAEPRYVLWCALNPSTADAEQDDPTIRRELAFARAWGFQAFVKVNLFALRSTDPDVLRWHRDPIGPGNDAAIAQAAAGAALVVAAWGAFPLARKRAEAVLPLLGPEVWCLGRTKDGAPRHPLYLPASAQLERFAA